MKTFILSALLVSLSFVSIAQEFEVPKNYKLDKAEDYPQYEDDIMSGFDWLMETPVGEQDAKRTEVSKFLLTWMMGSPDVHPELNEKFVTFIKSTPDALIVYLGGWTNYSLENDKSNDKVAGTTAALEAVIQFYQDNKKALGKDKNIEKFVKMKDAGTLGEFVEKNV